MRTVANPGVVTDSPAERIGVVAHTRGGRRRRPEGSWERGNGRDWGDPPGNLRIEPEARLGVNRSVEIAGTVGCLASVGLMCGEREGGDGTAVAAAGVRGDPRRTILQGIDVLLGERGALLVDLAHGWPGVIEFIGGREVATDSHKRAN